MVNTTKIWKVKWNGSIVYVRGQRMDDGKEIVAAFQPDNAGGGSYVFDYTKKGLSDNVTIGLINYIDDKPISDVEQTLLREKYYDKLHRSVSIDYFFWYRAEYELKRMP